LLFAAVAVSIVLTLWIAATRMHGDFAMTLPGGYARALNPTLWDSQDLRSSWAFHKDTYLHGPVQYLTLYPIVFLDSYRQIAWTLLPIYTLALAAAVLLMRSLLAELRGRPQPAFPVVASLVLFIPVLQAYAHREFEVVILLALIAALWCMVRDRRVMAGVLLAYVAWFKYIPLLFVGYLGLRGWVRAVAAFAVTSILILGAAHLLFDLRSFFNNNVPEHAANAFSLSRASFCQGWRPYDETLSSVRQGLCRLQDQLGMAMARDAYLVLCGLVAAVFLTTFVRLARQPLSPRDERWRRAVEFAVVTTVVASFFFGHYYYLSALWIPFMVLFARQQESPRRWSRALWLSAYILVSVSVAPLALVSWAMRDNSWTLYMKIPVYLYGNLLLIGLLLAEYRSLGAHRSGAPAL
jgi:hypothetical protein